MIMMMLYKSATLVLIWMIDNQLNKPTANVYRRIFERKVKKPKRYTDEMWYYLFLTSGRMIK